NTSTLSLHDALPILQLTDSHLYMTDRQSFKNHRAKTMQRARAIRQEDKLERRRDILAAAEQLFLGRPEGLASMDELAEAAGVAKDRKSTRLNSSHDQ